MLKYSECKSVGGEDCIFPFKFKGKTYTSCTTAESVNGAAWCATKVDSDDNVVRNFWKDCEEGCPMGETNAFFHQLKSQMIIRYFFTECKTVKGNNCIFPFKYKGKSYSSCTKVESANGAGWCATQVDRAGQVVRNRWEDCGLGCPGMEQGDTGIPCTSDGLFNIYHPTW